MCGLVPSERGRISPDRGPAAIPSSSRSNLGRSERGTSWNRTGSADGVRKRPALGRPIIHLPAMNDRFTTRRPPEPALYHGWLVVAAAFLVAMYGFGLGFYGVGVYLVALNALHGWPIAQLSSAITMYYVAGATLL